MFKFFSAVRKESLILSRDIAGLLLLFLMPMAMLIILALVQEFGWNAISKEPQIPVVFVNEDRDSLGVMIEQGLKQSHIFRLITKIDTSTVTRELARREVSKGNYQIGVVIPKGSTKKIHRKIEVLVTQLMSRITMPLHNPFAGIPSNDSVNVIVYFDPAVKGTFKNTFMSSMREFSLKIESSMIFKSFNDELQRLFPQMQYGMQDYKPSVCFSEIYPSGEKEESIPNTTQHNVPSWAIFAMFFIVIPLTGSIIKEREEGSQIRLHTLPVSYLKNFIAKVSVYLVVCVIQFILMVIAGVFILPLFGIQSLELDSHYGLLAVMTIVSSLAALGFGILIGAIARTHQQSSAFGAGAVVILTALGGLWVPIYFMPEMMRQVAACSPLNWAHQGFLDILLRHGTFITILPAVIKLLLFFVLTMGIAGIYRKLKSPFGTR
jgi:ABC-2 type transport system permease protein